MQIELYTPSVFSSLNVWGRPLKDKISQNEELKRPRLLLPAEVQVPVMQQKDITRPLTQSNEFF
jgi:hypothetical protein